MIWSEAPYLDEKLWSWFKRIGSLFNGVEKQEEDGCKARCNVYDESALLYRAS